MLHHIYPLDTTFLTLAEYQNQEISISTIYSIYSGFTSLCIHLCVCACMYSVLISQSCQTLCNPRTLDHQAHLSMEFSRQKYWSGLPFPSSLYAILSHVQIFIIHSKCRTFPSPQNPLICRVFFFFVLEFIPLNFYNQRAMFRSYLN